MSREFSTVAVIGLGYIGLPTAAILADHGVNTIGVDVSAGTVEAVNRGEVPFVEPGLREVLERAVASGQLSAQDRTPAADAYIVAVPTPFTDTHSADLSYIEAAADGIAPQLRGGELIVLESTSPPGATEHMAARILASRPDLSTDASRADHLLVAHCPERVLPGKIMEEMITNDRIIGGITQEAAEAAKTLYRSFCRGEILLTGAKTAEMAKLTENSFRDVNIAFANELSVICDELDINVWELIELANHHPRVNILQPGPGVGGHCIAVDPWFIVDAAPQQANLIRAARETNDAKPTWVLSRIEDAIAECGQDATVALLGLAFKANIDDLRESPALQIAESLALRAPQANLLAVEPHIDQLPASLAGASNVRLAQTEEAIAAADVVVLLVDHDVFKAIPAEQLGEARLIDSRGVWR
ncbi:UDP-N-acetyl-D-mannosamine dehydrogenase [Nesterenkonia lacusekhoensis]|uniref:UDP-N-acetyl-D-mannosaminuronic acid dehydrogenase n=1 Tax=Nesterenkonia lacusekhoensis TaxID=150832 RepID=A0ABS4T0H6_9MICC|nr:UDP-N-acetyl-D-mannosamine dehydrogenase [Nesterenkonia lacusekhoensis]MBP2317908.1 UDP-N-acetyl-D-mannosaminuronic acid dehydrogenase [Nesterenkonia lacusekhoensis]